MDAEYIGVGELVNAVRDEMGRAAGPKTRGNAAEMPTERTIRYYLQEGLIPEPFGKSGVNLRFGRIHLLAVLAIKRLQEYGMVNNAGIRELISGQSEAELEALLQDEVKAVTDPDEIVRYHSMSPTELNEEFGEPVTKVDMTRATNPATEFFLNKLFGKRSREESASTPPAPPAASLPPPPQASAPLFSATPSSQGLMASRIPMPPAEHSWKRSEIADGVELHVREDVDLAALAKERRSILDRVKRVLGL